MNQKKAIQLKLELETKLAKANLKQTEVAINKLTQSFKSLTKGTNDYKLAQSKLAQLQVKYAKQTQALALANQRVGSSMQNIATASGGATSSVLELGRVIQDAPYGLRGMANNITQLASQMAFATKSAGGFGAALKEMGKAMMGPLGVVFVISLVVSAMEMLQGSIGKTQRDLDKLAESSVTNAVSELTTLKSILQDTSISLEKKQEAIRLANEEYKDLNLSIDGTSESVLNALTALDLLIQKYSDVAYANAITELQTEAMKELAKSATDTEGSFGDLFGSFNAFVSGIEAFRLGGNGFDVAKQLNVAGLKEELDNIERLFNQKTKSDPSITYAELIFGSKYKPKGGSRGRADRLFREQVLNLDNFISEQEKSLEKSKERNVFRLLEIEQKYARENLNLTYETFVERQKLRFNQWAEQEAKRKKLTLKEFENTKQYADEEAKLNKSIADADNEYRTAQYNQKLAQEAAFQRKRLEVLEKFNDLILKATLKSAQAEAKAQMGIYNGTSAGSLGSPQGRVGAEGVDRQIAIQEELMAAEAKNFEDSLAIKIEMLQRERYLTQEIEAMVAEDRFQFQTDMVARELELERQKIDAKKNINQEYIDWFGGLGSIMKSISNDNEALAKTALLIEKGAAIASILIKTRAANQELMATAGKSSGEAIAQGKASMAAGAVNLAAGNPQGALQIKAGAKSVASGGAILASAKSRTLKNNIGAGISIAQILATTLESRSSGSGSGSGGSSSGGGGRTFDFNLVGSTGENQLAQGIAGQFNGPIQAYVVSSQITNQQELDNQISGTATIG